jgi:hypothetical protein
VPSNGSSGFSSTWLSSVEFKGEEMDFEKLLISLRSIEYLLDNPDEGSIPIINENMDRLITELNNKSIAQRLFREKNQLRGGMG